jgi:hypothetical protein
MQHEVTITDIIYDTDGEDVDLPKTLKISVSDEVFNDKEELETFLSDEISNITGFCHKGFVIEGE